MRPPHRGKPSLRETLEANQKALDQYATFADKPRYIVAMPPAPVKRAPAKPLNEPQKPTEPLEKEIQREIVQALKQNPEVVFVGRFNSGTSVNTDEYGNTRYTKFNTVAGFTDLHGMLRGGRAFYIEVKRKNTRATQEQAEFIGKVQAAGGLAGVARSVYDAECILKFGGPRPTL